MTNNHKFPNPMDGYNQLLPAPQIKTIPKRTWKLSKKTYT